MKTTPLPLFNSRGFSKPEFTFLRFACAGESVKIPGLREFVSPRTLTRREQNHDTIAAL